MAKIDELNILGVEETARNIVNRKIIPIREYYEPMDITDEQKERRIKAAERLEDAFVIALLLLSEFDETPSEMVLTQVMTQLQSDLLQAYESITTRVDDEDVLAHVSRVSQEIVESTARHFTDPYFTSEDRATVLAENDANYIVSYDEYEDAEADGCTMKRWKTMLDKKVRDSHRDVEGEEVPIGTPFFVGDSLLMFPGDTQFDPDPAEIVNCRCSVEYF